MNLRLVKTLPLIILLSSCSDSIVYEEKEESDLTRITKIEVVRKTCNKLTLNVTYYNNGDLAGYLKLSPNAGIPKQRWPFHPKLSAGLHTMEIQNGIQKSAEPAYSQEVSVSIDHILDNTWNGYIDRKTFVYEEKWDNDCLVK